jgi:hypothetical protein
MKLVINKLDKGGYIVSPSYDCQRDNFACSTLTEALDYVGDQFGPSDTDIIALTVPKDAPIGPTDGLQAANPTRSEGWDAPPAGNWHGRL